MRGTVDPSHPAAVPEDGPTRNTSSVRLRPAGSLPDIPRRRRFALPSDLNCLGPDPASASVGNCHFHPSPHLPQPRACSSDPPQPERYRQIVFVRHTSSLVHRDLADSADRAPQHPTRQAAVGSFPVVVDVSVRSPATHTPRRLPPAIAPSLS